MTGLRALSIEQAVSAPRWAEDAACRSVDPELFFDQGQDLITMTKGLISAANLKRREQAKAVCARCPVLMECREHYIDEVHGIYGGLDKDQRKALRDARRLVSNSNIDADLLGQQAFTLFLQGASLVGLAKKYGLRTSQLRAYMDHYLGTPQGMRMQLEHEIRKAHDEGLTEGETSLKLGIPLAKVAYLRRRLGLIRRTVSAAPAKLSEDRWDSAVSIGNVVLSANYIGESADGWIFMSIKYPKASTRRWMRAEDVHLGESVRRHLISKGVGSGAKRKRDAGDSA